MAQNTRRPAKSQPVSTERTNEKNAASRVSRPVAAAFLPISREDMESRGWDGYDFLLVTGDAYVDHSSFGTAIISRVLESQGYRVAICAQPDVNAPDALARFGRPDLAVLVNSGNMDSMVAHYTVAKKRRSYDYYSPGGKMGFRPDRALLAYSRMARKAFPGCPVVIGGIEASLRRFAHYDYWADKVLPSVLVESGADLLIYGMGELPITAIASRLARGDRASYITDVRGTCYVSKQVPTGPFVPVQCAPFEKCASDKTEYAKTCRLQYREMDHTSDKAIVQRHGSSYVVVNPPARPLTSDELDTVYELPYARYYHPVYDSMGGIPAIEEVEFSITHNRGCAGGCSFCALAFHQGRYIQSRSIESCVREAELMARSPRFKGYISDVGGPTANFRHPTCKKQLEKGLCRDRVCLAPEPCPALEADHSEYIELLRRVSAVPGVKKVFVRSGVRYDYVMYDRKHGDEFLRELVNNHVSGQLRVAPEHCSDNVLGCMNKPPFSVYLAFEKRYKELCRRAGLEQYLVPYLMSSHPGSTVADAAALTEYLAKKGREPEQVQDFYPTPGTIATCMYYTGIDPRTMKPVYVAKSPEEKAMQRALLQWKRPENRVMVEKALSAAGRRDLLPLVRPARAASEKTASERARSGDQQKSGTKNKRRK